MNRIARALRAVLASATLLVALTACQPPPKGARVLIYGDSITIEAKGAGDAATLLRDYRVDWTGTKYMTAPCNGIAISKDIGYVPDVVVINYSGNNGSFQGNCMNGEKGEALAARYEKDVQTLINTYRNGRTRIVVVGAPTRRPHLADGNLVFSRLKALAEKPSNDVAFFDGGRHITPNRNATTREMACLPSEKGNRCGTNKAGTRNYVRDERHDHLCPTGGRLNGTCNMYSSGSVRLTMNLLDGIRWSKVAKR